MSKDKSEVKNLLYRILMLAVPAAIENILDTLVQYVDAAMVGRLGEKATATVSISTSVTWLIGCPMYAAAVGIVAMISKADGEGNREKIKTVANLATWSTIVIGLIELVITLLISPYVPILMGAEKDLHKLASLYFFIICTPMLFRCALTTLAGAIRGLGDTKTPMFITFLMNFINIVLDYIFIYLCGYGVIGAAVATAISFTVGGIAMYICFINKMKLERSELLRMPAKSAVSECLKIGVPSALGSIVSCTGYVVFAALVSGMGTVIFAAHSLAVTAEMLFYMAGHGIQAAVATLSGFFLGRRDEKAFNKMMKYSAVLMIGLQIVNGILLFIFAYPLMSLFTPNEEVMRLGADMLKLVAFSEPFFGLTMVYKGSFMGLGLTKEPFYIDLIGMWGIRILSTFICVKLLAMSLTAVWGCMIADNVAKCLMVMGLFFYMKSAGKLFKINTKEVAEG